MRLSTATKDNESLAAIKSCNLINLSIKQGKSSSRYLPLYITLFLSSFLSVSQFASFDLHFQQHFPALALKANFISISKWRRGESIMLLIGSLMGAVASAYSTAGRGCCCWYCLWRMSNNVCAPWQLTFVNMHNCCEKCEAQKWLMDKPDGQAIQQKERGRGTEREREG